MIFMAPQFTSGRRLRSNSEAASFDARSESIMELRHLRSFLVVAEQLHFGRAADRLGLTQSAVTRHLQLLETDLGFPLLERTSRRVTLTAAGRALRERISGQVEALDLAVEESRAIHAGKAGRLRIGYVANLSYVFLPRLIERLRAAVPNVTFEVHEEPTPRQIELIQAERMDVGIALAPLDDPSLLQRWLFSERLVLMMKEGHPLAKKSAVELASLEREPFVICPRYIRTGLHEVVRQRCLAAGFQVVVGAEVGGRALLEEMVAKGAGLSIVPESAAQVPRQGVIFRQLRGRVDPIDVHVIWRAGNRDPLLARCIQNAMTCAEEVRVQQAPRPRKFNARAKRVHASRLRRATAAGGA